MRQVFLGFSCDLQKKKKKKKRSSVFHILISQYHFDGPLLGPLKPTGPFIGLLKPISPLKSMGPAIIVPSAPPFGGPVSEQVLLLRPYQRNSKSKNCRTRVPKVFEERAALDFFELTRAPQSVLYRISKYFSAGENGCR